MQDDEKIKSLAQAATKLPEQKRTEFLQQQTNNDAEIMHRVTTLIAAQTKQHGTNMAELDFAVGDCIGVYKIIEEIGHGGMGTVFLVEQSEPIKRQLALKVVRLGMDTKEVLSRFNQERQALALMSHPNVAAVYDAGATDHGRPYFVMEYVSGEAITHYANLHRLNINERIQLIIQACKGVLHAHQKGILHRDIKPGNIMVAEKDNKPLVKIIDFGVAKSTQKLSQETVYTEVGSFIGTPYYMSPEQASASPLGVDTRTDVYSLGILLYELLVGSLPYDDLTFNNKSAREIQQIIKDHEAPTPFTKLKSNTLTHDALAQQRQSSVNEIKKSLKGDLSSIVMQAIAKDPDQRYVSVSAFEADLMRYLAGLPVDAQPPTARYRLGKFLHRHKLLVGSLIGIVLALSTGLIVAISALKHAEKESVHAAAVSSMLSDILLNADPENIDYREQITLKEVIVGLEQKLDSRELLSGSEFNRARELGLENSLQWTLYEHLADVHHSVGNFEAAEKNYLQAIQLRLQVKDQELLPLVTLDLKLSKTLVSLGELERAEALFNKSMRAIDPPQDAAEAEILLDADGVFRNKGKIDDSIVFERHLLEVAESFFGLQSEKYAWQLIELSANLLQTGDQALIQEALVKVQQARSLAHEMSAPNLQIEFNARRFIIYILNSTKPEQAIVEGESFVAWCEKEFGKDHIRTIDAGTLYTYVLLWSGKYQEALQMTDKLIPILSKSVDQDHYLYRSIFKYRGNALVLLNRFDEAIPVLEQELSIAVKEESQPEIAYASEAISQSAYYLGDMDKALSSIKTAIENENNVLNKSIMLGELAQIQFALDEWDLAVEAAEESLVANDKNAMAHSVLAYIAYKQENNAAAIEHLRTAEEKQRLNAATSGNDYMTVLADLALMLLLSNQLDKAQELADQLNFTEDQSPASAYIELVNLAAEHQSGNPVDQSAVVELYKSVDQVWSRATRQNQAAVMAAELAGIKIN